MENGDKRMEKVPLGERLSKRLDIEPDVLVGGCQIELRGRHRVKLYGAKRILCYSDTAIRLRLGREVVLVEGARLECSSFTHSVAVIVGRIDGVSFEREAKV